MQILIRMPDERLTTFADVYGHWPLPMENISTFCPGLIAFNLSGAHVEIDGQTRPEPVLMGIANNPTYINYTISGGDIVTLRCPTSAYDRLFDIDPSVEGGIVAMDPQRHPKVASVYEHLKAAPRNPRSWFDALDQALLALVPDAKPMGLPGRMVQLLVSSSSDLTVAEVAEELGCTIRTLERACKRRFGMTPKRLLRGQRLARTLQSERLSDERVELMPDFAYADLPHYLNEIRRVTGLNRSQLGDEKLLGQDFPYVYLWPDGSRVDTQEDFRAWDGEMMRRYRDNPA